MKTRVIISIAAVSLGLLIAAVPQNTTHPYKLTAEQLLTEIQSEQQFISPAEVADFLVQKDPLVQLIDIRTPQEFEKFSLPGAINIPLESILLEEFEEVLNQDEKTNIFYSNSYLQANEAWMITRQLGYKNNYVLMGGLNYWVDAIMNPENPKSVNSNDEFAKYNFSKAASMALGGGNVSLSADSGSVPTNAPKTNLPKTDKKKKKKISGGCS